MIHLWQEESFAFRGRSPTCDVGSKRPYRESKADVRRETQVDKSMKKKRMKDCRRGQGEKEDGKAVTQEMEREWGWKSALDRWGCSGGV